MEEIGKEGERPQFFPERKPIFGETPAVAGQRERLAELEPRVKYLEQMQREGNATIEDQIRRQAFNEQIDDEFRALGVTPLKLDGDVRVPRVTAGEVRTLFPAIGEGGAKVAAGLQQAAADVAEGVLSPWGIATFGLGALEPAAAKPMMQAFVLDMARNSPEQAMEAAEALRKGDTERATRSIANLLATGYFIGSGLTHGEELGRVKPGAAGRVEGWAGRRLLEETQRRPGAMPGTEGETRLVQPGEPEPQRRPVPQGAQAPEGMFRIGDPEAQAAPGAERVGGEAPGEAGEEGQRVNAETE